jgi:hypothetical protein
VLLYAGISVLIVNVLAVVAIARLGRRFSTIEQRAQITRVEPVVKLVEPVHTLVESVVRQVDPVAEHVEQVLEPRVLVPGRSAAGVLGDAPISPR